MTADLKIAWIDRVLLPYVKQSQAGLMMDSYEAHKCDKILTHLQQYPNIHIGIIVGGTTAFSQPVDITVNKEFKVVCCQKSLQYTNQLVKTLVDEIGEIHQPSIKSNILLVNNQVVIAEKDQSKARTRRPKTLTQAMLLRKITVEDRYSWINAAYNNLQNQTELIRKSFIKAGYVAEVDRVD